LGGENTGRFFIIRTKILKALYADKEWREKLESAASEDEKIKIMEEFCRKMGYETGEIIFTQQKSEAS